MFLIHAGKNDHFGFFPLSVCFGLCSLLWPIAVCCKSAIFCLEGLLCPWSPPESWPLWQAGLIKSQHREKTYMAGQPATYLGSNKSKSKLLVNLPYPQEEEEERRITHELSLLCAVDEPASQTWLETKPCSMPVTPRAMPPPSQLALDIWWMNLRQEQLAQLVLLGIAGAASQAIGDPAGLSEIALCGKERPIVCCLYRVLCGSVNGRWIKVPV